MAWIANNSSENVNVGSGFRPAGARGLTADASRTFLTHVFQTMALGLGVTGLVAALVASSPAAIAFFLGNPVVLMILILAQLGMVFGFSAVATRASAGAAAYGAITKRNLDGMGSFLFMGLIGLVLASIVNIFLGSPAIYWLTTFIGVLVFTGLAAYDAAKLKQLAATMDVSGDQGRKAALRGALMLYLDFINLFLMLLRIFGGRRRD